MSNKILLKQLFSGLQNQMNAQLSTNRENIMHSTSKGDALENAWIEWLKKYLPNRYSVDKGIVIDSNGDTSDQIDVIIYDNWFTPFIFSQNGFHYIPAEGVYAIFECKTDISGSSEGISNIEYAGKKIESVRRLKRTTTSIISIGEKYDPRGLTKIVGGILTSTKSGNRNNDKTIVKHLMAQKGIKSIDCGCIADYGAFFVDYDNKEDKSIEDFDQRYLNYYKNRNFEKAVFSKEENSLVTFFMQLTRYLQQAIGTVQAINLQTYLDSIKEEIDSEI